MQLTPEMTLLLCNYNSPVITVPLPVYFGLAPFYFITVELVVKNRGPNDAERGLNDVCTGPHDWGPNDGDLVSQGPNVTGDLVSPYHSSGQNISGNF